jgi:hypothetical protein
MAIPSFSSMPRRNQLLIAYGVPAAILALLLFWMWKALGTLGPVDKAIAEASGQPSGLFFTRNTPSPAIWADIVDTQTQINAQMEVAKTLPEVQKTYNGLLAEKKIAEERLPRETEKAEMRQVIQRLARDIPKDIGTVELASVNIIEGGERGGDTKVITFQTDLKGDQDGIIKFIDEIEKNQRFMSVQNLTIHTGGMTADQVAHKVVNNPHAVHLDIVTYVFNPDKKTASQ